MAVVKCIALFQLATNPSGASEGNRIAGWSESLLSIDVDLARVKTYFAAWCEARARLLTSSARIVGQRYQLINPTGRTQTAANQFVGSLGATDVPQMAATFTVGVTGSNNIRRFTLRGLPDRFAVEGELKPTPELTGPYTSLLFQLTGFGMNCINLAATTVPVTSIAPDGTFVLQQALTFAANQYLHIRNARDVSGNTHNGRFHIATRTDDQNGKLSGWVGLATLGGTARPDAKIFRTFDYTTGSQLKLTLRKAGRPFDQYRGRASARA